MVSVRYTYIIQFLEVIFYLICKYYKYFNFSRNLFFLTTPTLSNILTIRHLTTQQERCYFNCKFSYEAIFFWKKIRARLKRTQVSPGCRSSNGSGSPLRYSSVSFSINSDILVQREDKVNSRQAYKKMYHHLQQSIQQSRCKIKAKSQKRDIFLMNLEI